MGNTFENRQAEEMVHGRVHRLLDDSESPQLNAEKLAESLEVYSFATTDIANPTLQLAEGYELYVLPTSTAGVKVRISFANKRTDTQVLQAGEGVRVKRRFGRFFIVDAGGAAGTVHVGVTRNALMKRVLPVQVRTPYLEPLNAAGPAGSWSSSESIGAGVLADTGALVAGVYEVKAFATGSASPNEVSAVWLEHRNAANAANIARQRLSLAFQTGPNECHPLPVTLAGNERIRLNSDGTNNTFLSGSLSWRRVG